MDANELDDFFATKPITFSENWKIELAQRFERLKEKNTRQNLGTLHNTMIQEMLDVGKRWLRGKFSNYETKDIEDISQNAFIKWYSSFKAIKGSNTEFPEHLWFLICIYSAQIDWYHKQNPTITTNVVQLDEDGNPILDEVGKEMHEKIKIFFVSFPDNANDSLDDSEELESTQKAKTDSEKIYELAADEKVDNENEEEQTKLIELAGKRFSETASNEIMKYYLLSGRIKANGNKNVLPGIKAIYKPLKKFISYQVRPEFDNISDVSINALNRLQYLKNAEKRKWMEMAIAEMRKSKNELDVFVQKMIRTQHVLSLVKQKKQTYTSILKHFSDSKIGLGKFVIELLKNEDWVSLKREKKEGLSHIELTKSGEDFHKINFNESEYRKSTPILGSVVLDKKGKFVASCFKGKIDRTHPDKKEKEVTFDNHCEFSLLTQVIKEEDLHLVKDGILYVTHEPCNKRGFCLDGGEETPKIPCAVRCVEAGLKKVFIGTKDNNRSVKDKGREILKSGKYIFKIKNGALVETEKEIKEEALLEVYFKAKNYSCEDIGDERIYTIGSPVEDLDFEPDLIEKVRQLNSEFLQKRSHGQFRL